MRFALVLLLVGTLLAIPEREPILLQQGGYMLQDATQMARFCPQCINNNNKNNNSTTMCCVARLLDKYSCVEQQATELENPLCMACMAQKKY